MIDMFWTDPRGEIFFLPDITAMTNNEHEVTIRIGGAKYSWKSDGFPEDSHALVKRWKKVKMLAAGLHSDQVYMSHDEPLIETKLERKNPSSGPDVLMARYKAIMLINEAEIKLTKAASQAYTGDGTVKSNLTSAKKSLEKALIQIEKIL